MNDRDIDADIRDYRLNELWARLALKLFIAETKERNSEKVKLYRRQARKIKHLRFNLPDPRVDP